MKLTTTLLTVAFATVSFGQATWSTYAAQPTSNEQAGPIGFDGSGEVCVLGSYGNATTTGLELLAFSPTTGAFQWKFDIAAPSSWFDLPQDVVFRGNNFYGLANEYNNAVGTISDRILVIKGHFTSGTAVLDWAVRLSPNSAWKANGNRLDVSPNESYVDIAGDIHVNSSGTTDERAYYARMNASTGAVVYSGTQANGAGNVDISNGPNSMPRAKTGVGVISGNTSMYFISNLKRTAPPFFANVNVTKFSNTGTTLSSYQNDSTNAFRQHYSRAYTSTLDINGEVSAIYMTGHQQNSNQGTDYNYCAPTISLGTTSGIALISEVYYRHQNSTSMYHDMSGIYHDQSGNYVTGLSTRGSLVGQPLGVSAFASPPEWATTLIRTYETGTDHLHSDPNYRAFDGLSGTITTLTSQINAGPSTLNLLTTGGGRTIANHSGFLPGGSKVGSGGAGFYALTQQTGVGDLDVALVRIN